MNIKKRYKIFAEVLIRPIPWSLYGIPVLIGAILANDGVPPILSFVILLMIVFIALTATSLVSDFFDREIDRINRPERLIPSGKVNQIFIILYSITLFAFAFTLTLIFFSLVTLVLIATAVLIGCLYSGGLKLKSRGFLGCISVGGINILTFFTGWSIYKVIDLEASIIALVVFSLTSALIIGKDFHDVEGDRKFNIQTLPVKFGPQKAASIYLILIISSYIIAFFPCLLNLLSYVYLFMIFPTGIFAIYNATLLLKDPGAENSEIIYNRIRPCLPLSLLSLPVGIITI